MIYLYVFGIILIVILSPLLAGILYYTYNSWMKDKFDYIAGAILSVILSPLWPGVLAILAIGAVGYGLFATGDWIMSKISKS